MKLIKIVILLSIGVSLAFAQELSQRVLITKTSQKTNLPQIHHTLQQLGVKMYIQTLTSGYYIYSASYTNPKNAKNVLKRVQGKFPYAKIVTIGAPKINTNTDTKTTPQEPIPKETSQEEPIIVPQVFADTTDSLSTKILKNFYVDLALGYANTSGSTNDLSASKLATSGMSYLLEGGYEYGNGLSLSLAYLNASTSDISIHNIYGAVNYRYDLDNDFCVGGGLLLGYSSLEISSYASSSASKNLVYGFDLAAEYKLMEKLYLFSKYQGFFLNHTISINNTASISFKYTHNILFGVGYKF